MAGIDPELYTGFAAGFGVERFAMVMHDIQDLREFTKSDVRFLNQFPHFHDDGTLFVCCCCLLFDIRSLFSPVLA
jgi:hypothetical protein